MSYVDVMTVAKIIELVGSSTKSFDDAVVQALKDAAKTVKNIHGVQVVGFTAKVKGDEISEFRADVKIAFGVER
ncbi:MAG: dodecin family protein [Candidatus Geothermarchaeales archaeon]